MRLPSALERLEPLPGGKEGQSLALLVLYLAVLSHILDCVSASVKSRSTQARRVLISSSRSHAQRPATVESGQTRVRCECTHCPSLPHPLLLRCQLACTRPVSSSSSNTRSYTRTGSPWGLPELYRPLSAKPIRGTAAALHPPFRPTLSATIIPSLPTDLDRDEPRQAASGTRPAALRERWQQLGHGSPWHPPPPPLLPPPPPPSHPRRPHMNPILLVSLINHHQRRRRRRRRRLATTTTTTTKRQAGGTEEGSGSSGHIVALMLMRTASKAPSKPTGPSPTTRRSRPISSRRRRHQSRSRAHRLGLHPLRPRPRRHLPRPLL